MTQKVPMTKEGHDKLLKDLDNLLKVERPKNIRDIEEARAHGDLSENAEYHAAKEKQGHIDAKKRELEFKLAHAQIIDVSRLTNEKVVFGARLRLGTRKPGTRKNIRSWARKKRISRKAKYPFSRRSGKP
jgi:transcription elongation factor GreA